jgi:large subunit ribosomal protein L4
MSGKKETGRKEIEVVVRDPQGNEIERLSIDPKLLGGWVRRDLLRQALLAHEHARRLGTAKTKSRGEVAFSTKKPWRQKGTGRARVGSRRSPLWRKGGVIFGPKPRSYRVDLPRKMRLGALRSALLVKLLDRRVALVTEFGLSGPRTREAVRLLANLRIPGSCLVGLPEHGGAARLAFRNLPEVVCRPVREFFPWELLRYRTLLLTKPTWETLLDKVREGA